MADDDDQQWRTYQPPRRRADESAGEQATPEPLDPPVETIEAAEYLALVDQARKEVLGRVFKVALLVVITAILIGAIRSVFLGADDGAVAEADGEQSLVMADFFGEVKQDLGDQVYELVLYDDYAIVTVPVDGGDRRSLSYMWRPADGFQEWNKNSGETRSAWDIDRFDPSLRDSLCKQVRRLVEDANLCYLIVKAPEVGRGDWIVAYASNDFRESGRLTAKLDGTVLERNGPGE